MKAGSESDLYRRLPGVDELLRHPSLQQCVKRAGKTAVTDAARTVLSQFRDEIAAGRLNETGVDLLFSSITIAVKYQLRQFLGYSLYSVINATGVILHTNLGRAPLSPAALDHLREIAASYSNLEFDITTADRGKRDIHVDRLFQKLLNASDGSGKESVRAVSTIVVNNNAAAVLLALNTLAENGEVIVSRGELVEIGGSFRIPDVMSKSNAVLREVGTTNRTRIGDYERAINDNTKLLLRVHRSNFEITGFTEQPKLEELVELAHRRKLPLVEDLGSGALFDLRAVGVNGEPSVLDSLRAGVSVVTYSGDKLLGGPQAGLLSGESSLIARMRANSLFRALRVDKLTYAALEATLLSYVKGEHDAIPTLRMMRLSKEEIGARARSLAEEMQSSEVLVEVIDGDSLIGGGSAPSAVLPTQLLAISLKNSSAAEVAERLRFGNPAIVTRVEQGRVLLDLRTVFPEQDGLVLKAIHGLACSPDNISPQSQI